MDHARTPFVWIDQHGSGRNVHAYFRREVFLKEAPQRAELNLFADSRYHLYVNGAFVQYGPVRHYPERPLYDSHDLTPHLRAGKNVIAVHVASWGMETFHHVNAPGCFAAWGEIECRANDTVNLSTEDGWKCRRAGGYDTTAPKFSFAQAPLHLHDAQLDTPQWNQVECPALGWSNPVALKNQSAWGTPAARTIPHLTQTTLLPRVLLGAYELDDDDIYSFRINGTDTSTAEFGACHTVFACTWIYSPRKQDVVCGAHWGEHHLNGGAQLKRVPEPQRPTREVITFALNEGWNFYCVRYGMIWGAWDYQLLLPKSAGLKVSATKELNGDVAFLTAGPFESGEAEAVKALAYPFNKPEDLPRLSAGWTPQIRRNIPSSPGLGMAALRFERTIPSLPTTISDLKASAGSRTAFVFDFGRRTLGRIFVEYDAPAGTAIDVGYTEDFRDGQPAVLRRAGIFTAEREIARGGAGRLELFEPRGFRYLQVSVLNATGPVNIKRVGAVEQVYPFEPRGRFECSDPLLNEVWKLGWNALRLCAEDVYTDCPLRERTLYAGDMLAEMATTVVASGDLRLVRRCIELFTQHQTETNPNIGGRVPAPHDVANGKVNAVSDFALITLLTWAWYVERSGDGGFARAMYPSYRRLVENALECRGPDGLIPHSFAFIEWVEFERGDKNTCVHALLSRCFMAMSKIAETIGEKSDVKRYADAAAELANVTREKFWDAEASSYRDGFKDGKPLEKHNPCSSAWPVLFSVANSSQEQMLEAHFEAMLSKSMNAGDRTLSPYGGFYALGALYRLGQIKLAEELMRREWGRMALEGSDTVWEQFENSASLCHAWAGAPTFYLSTKVLGVASGFPELEPSEQLVIAPQSETLDWARGVVPQRSGLVAVDWRIDGENLRVIVDAPAGVKWTVAPVGRLAEKKLWVNGSPADARQLSR